jgi:hypothetical protein
MAAACCAHPGTLRQYRQCINIKKIQLYVASWDNKYGNGSSLAESATLAMEFRSGSKKSC